MSAHLATVCCYAQLFLAIFEQLVSIGVTDPRLAVSL
jgi:hypothetical protein